jgi:hypothetical protein
MIRRSAGTAGVMILTCLLLVSRAAAAETAITVVAGERPLPAMPVFWQPARTLDAKQAYVLVAPGGLAIRAQLDEKGRLWWWAGPLDRGQTATYRLQAAGSGDTASRGVRVVQVRAGLIQVSLDGKLFTALNYGKELPRPFLYPVIGPTDTAITRDFPMKDVELERRNKRQDHAHHRSIWTAWGDVRSPGAGEKGIDYWAEGPECGLQRVKQTVRMVEGPVFGQVQAEVEWVTPAGHRQLTEHRTYTFFRGDERVRGIDVKVLFSFTDGEVTFGDTSEAGIVALRLATMLDEAGGGRMFNSNGRTGERQCWGQPADWCDYVGQADGKTVGVAVLDSDTNLNHPPRWHIRGYGLFAVNPIGLSDFTDQRQTRTKTWKAGETAEFNYRILIHEGNTQAAGIADHYDRYNRPPTVTAK